MAKQTFTTGQVLTAAQMTSLQQTAMGGGDTTAKTASYVLVAADAGTTVAMNAAGSTTITVNTGLFSAGDTVFIQNRGAGTCVITSGTATVNTHGSLSLGQYEGGQLYFTATGAAIFFDVSQSTGMTNPMTTTGDMIYSSSGSTPARLGIGSSGQVLTVSSGIPSWAAASSGALTLIEAATFTATSSIVTGAVFSATYNNYLLLFTANTSNDDINPRFRTGSSTTTTNYNFAATGTYNTSPYSASNYGLSTGANAGTLGGSVGSYAVMNIANPYKTEKTHWTIQNDWTQASTLMVNKTTTGFLNDTTSYDKLDITCGGNVTGYYAIYGYSI